MSKAGMENRQIRTRDRQSGGSPVRTVRISDDIWGRAQRRAKRDGVSMSAAVHLMVQGYSEGKISLPRVELVYEESGKAPAQPKA